ncbi:hypothetical protein [Streptomyces mutomycini]|uniref:hypothetical protein n=1 Tax=Streptomyces mutomycini TaxID=284036 RepID=UPI00340B7E00
MVKELYAFFRMKLRKGNGVWWALAYTFDQWRWLRIQNDPKRLQEWFNRDKGV